MVERFKINFKIYFSQGLMVHLSCSGGILGFPSHTIFCFVRYHPMIIYVQFGFNQISSFRKNFFFFIFRNQHSGISKHCPELKAILDSKLTQKHVCCKGPSNKHASQVFFLSKGSVVLEKNNFIKYFPIVL